MPSRKYKAIRKGLKRKRKALDRRNFDEEESTLIIGPGQDEK